MSYGWLSIEFILVVFYGHLKSMWILQFVGNGVSYIVKLCWWIGWFKSSICLLNSCLAILSIVEIRVLKSLAIIVNLSVAYSFSIRFWFMNLMFCYWMHTLVSLQCLPHDLITLSLFSSFLVKLLFLESALSNSNSHSFILLISVFRVYIFFVFSFKVICVFTLCVSLLQTGHIVSCLTRYGNFTF